MSTADDITLLLADRGPLTDAQIADALHLRHQQVNQACRRLVDARRIVRAKGPRGHLVNRLLGQPAPREPDGQTPDDIMRPLTEDEIKLAVKQHLEGRGYTVQVMWGRSRGIDIDAVGPDGRFVIEAKGQVVSQPQQTNYFLNALGELVQRMSDATAVYALALPDEPRTRGLVSRLPALARERLRLAIFFVSRDDGELQVRQI